MPQPSEGAGIVHTSYMSPFDISREEEAKLHDHARSKVPTLLRASQPDKSRWKLLKSRKNVELWEEVPSKTDSTYTIRSCVTISAPVEELLKVMNCKQSNAFRSLMRITYGNVFGDGAILYNNSMNDQESLSIKWMAYKCSNPLVLDTDFSVVEYSKLYMDDEIIPRDNQHDRSQYSMEEAMIHGGGPKAYWLWESVHTKHCPSLLQTHNIERGYIRYGGIVLYPTDHSAITKVVFICSIEQPPPLIRRHANKLLFQQLGLSLINIQRVVNVHRMQLQLSDPTRNVEWIDDGRRFCCFLCARRFTSLRRRHHCRLCGEVICRQCSVYKDADLPSVGLTILRICKRCEINGRRISIKWAGVDVDESPTLSRVRSDSITYEQRETLPSLLPSSEILASRNNVGTVDRNTISGNSEFANDISNFSTKRVVERRYFPIKNSLSSGFMGERRHSMVSSSSTSTTSSFGSISASGNSVSSSNSSLPLQSLSGIPTEDIFLLLCDLASQTLDCQFAAVSVLHDDIHYLKVKKCPRLLRAPANFRCCEPILKTQKPLSVLDTLNNPEVKDLPFVVGPQKARFYAGCPLVTSSGTCVGAVCVFDSKVRTALASSEVKVMQNLASLAIVSIENRRQRLSQETVEHDPQTDDMDDFRSTPEYRMMRMLSQAYQTQQQVQSTQAYIHQGILL